MINKADLVKDKDTLLPVIQQLAEYELFDEIVPLSALRNEGIERFREVVFRHLPEGPHMFSADDITDQTERQLVEEIVREKLMRQLGDEIPHSAVVRIEKFTNGDPVTEIFADIYVERSSQKSIVIGKQGKRLKLIGSEARKDAEELLQRPIMLHLWVKVRKGWTNDPKLMQRLGYE